MITFEHITTEQQNWPTPTDEIELPIYIQFNFTSPERDTQRL